MARWIYERQGLTIPEFLIAVVLMVSVIGGALAIYIMSITAWKEGCTQIALQRKASIAMEKMVRGVDGTRGIREGIAGTLTLEGNDCINIDVDMNEPPTSDNSEDDTNISFYKSGNQLFYDPDTSSSGYEFSIAENVVMPSSGNMFTVSGSTVTINLGMQDTVGGRVINVDLSTQVKLRN